MKSQMKLAYAAMTASALFLATWSPVAAPSSGPTPLENALLQWKAGQKENAVKEFLKIDWAKTVAFSPGSPLATHEKDLAALSATAREKLIGEVMLSLKDLKELARAAKDQASAASDPQAAKRILEKLDQCGTALNRPDSLKILQLTAQAIKKLAAPKTS